MAKKGKKVGKEHYEPKYKEAFRVPWYGYLIGILVIVAILVYSAEESRDQSVL